MLRITDASVLRSVINEAGRQSDFYQRKQDMQKREAWSQIEAYAWDAMRRGGALLITVSEGNITPIPIKACE